MQRLENVIHSTPHSPDGPGISSGVLLMSGILVEKVGHVSSLISPHTYVLDKVSVGHTNRHLGQPVCAYACVLPVVEGVHEKMNVD